MARRAALYRQGAGLDDPAHEFLRGSLCAVGASGGESGRDAGACRESRGFCCARGCCGRRRGSARGPSRCRPSRPSARPSRALPAECSPSHTEWPGWSNQAGSRERRSANAPDSAPVSPTLSANSTSNATPACDTSPSPSAVTSTVLRRAAGFTNWVSSWVACRDFSNPDSHGPGGRSHDPTSAHYRRFEARRECPLAVAVAGRSSTGRCH